MDSAHLNAVEAENRSLREQLKVADEHAEKIEALLDPYISWDGEPSEVERLREAVDTTLSWIRHWKADIAAGLMPTRESLEHAEIICRKARRKEAVS